MNWTKKKIVAAIMIGLVGTGAAAFKTGMIEKPSAGLEDKGDWGQVTENNITVVTSVWTHNPYNHTLNMSWLGAGYKVHMNGVKVAEGQKKGVTLKPGNSTLTVRTQLEQDELPDWWVSHIRNGGKTEISISPTIFINLGPGFSYGGPEVTKSFSTDIIDLVDKSLESMHGTYEGPGINTAGVSESSEVEITGSSAEWGEVTQSKTAVLMYFDIHNPNAYPIPVPGFTGSINLNDVKVAEWDASNVDVIKAPTDKAIAPGETQEIGFRVFIDNSKMDDWLTSHVKKHELTEGRINAKMVFNAGGAELTVPSSGGMNCDFRMKTSILVDDQNASSSFDGCEYSRTQNGGDSSGSSPLDNSTNQLNTSDLENSTSGNDSEDTIGGLTGGL